MELTELCKELNNWFDLKRYFGEFTIEDGTLKDDLGLLDNQYFRIVGSIFNDGVHQFGANDSLTDETFDGAVWAMAVPPQVVALCEKITDWEDKYGDTVSSPYTSESFGGYSYSKNGVSTSSVAENGFKGAFANELNRWRKA